jgi:hypothetical protein
MLIDAAIGIPGTQVIIYTYLTNALLAHRNGEIGVVDDAVPDPGTDLDRGTVAADVVEADLGVVLDDKDRRFRPVLAVRDLIDPLGEVVVGDLGARLGGHRLRR